MKKYSLKIELKENPVPYKRTTQRAKWLDSNYQKYEDYKELLKWHFTLQNKIPCTKALAKNKTYTYKLLIGFKNKKHGDADNSKRCIRCFISKR